MSSVSTTLSVLYEYFRIRYDRSIVSWQTNYFNFFNSGSAFPFLLAFNATPSGILTLPIKNIMIAGLTIKNFIIDSKKISRDCVDVTYQTHEFEVDDGEFDDGEVDDDEVGDGEFEVDESEVDEVDDDEVEVGDGETSRTLSHDQLRENDFDVMIKFLQTRGEHDQACCRTRDDGIEDCDSLIDKHEIATPSSLFNSHNKFGEIKLFKVVVDGRTLGVHDKYNLACYFSLGNKLEGVARMIGMKDEIETIEVWFVHEGEMHVIKIADRYKLFRSRVCVYETKRRRTVFITESGM